MRNFIGEGTNMSYELHDRLQNVESAPAFDPSCNPRCSPDRAIHPIAKELLYTPHYRLVAVSYTHLRAHET